MANRRFVLSPAAEADLESIWLYTANQWSVEQADRYTSDVQAACRALAEGRRKGRPIDCVRHGYMKLGVGSHFLVFRIVDGIVDIVRILHQRMDIQSHLETEH